MIRNEVTPRRPTRPRRRVTGACVALLVAAAIGAVPRGGGSGGPAWSGRTSNRQGSNPNVASARLLAARMPVCFSSSIATPPVWGAGSVTAIDPIGPGTAVPFAVRVTPGGHWSFVSVGSARRAGIEVFSNGHAGVRHVRSIRLPTSRNVRWHGADGEAMTRNGKYLLVATEEGAAVVDVSRAESGAPNALLGMLQDSNLTFTPWLVAVSPDSRYVFVTSPKTSQVAIFNLARALAHGFGPADLVGLESIPSPQDVAVSPNGRWLYVTSYPNSLYLVNLERRTAGADPAVGPFVARSVVTPGCFLNRVTLSASGALVWVTSSLDNELLGYSSAKLLRDPSAALVAAVRVGDDPTGLALVDHGRRIAIADGDWGAFYAEYPAPPKGARSNVVIVSVQAALSHKRALLGTVLSGRDPRSLAASAGGMRLFVVNSVSRQLEVISTGARGNGPRE